MATTPNTPAVKTNRIGLTVVDYRGSKSTLCAGCGHNAISERIIDAFYEMGIEPEQVAKLSGIGCSSKSPAYFMGRAHSFNAVHGRMPPLRPGRRWPITRCSHRCERRRRHGLDWHGPVRTLDAPQSADDLHH